MRYRLRTLLIVLIGVGLVSLALRSPNHWWNAGIFASLVVLLLTTVLVAIYRSESTRAAAIGFIVFATGYLWIQGSSWPGPSASLALPADDLTQWSYNKIHAGDPFVPYSMFAEYKGICTSALAVVVGTIGATIAHVLYSTRPKVIGPTAEQR
jgi:hypothetical protein